MKAIIFDVDGTLHKPVPELSQAVHAYLVKRVADRKRISTDKAEYIFQDLVSQYKSATRVLEVVGLGDVVEITKQAENFSAKLVRQYIKRDRKLVQMVKKLRSEFSLYTLRNGTKTGTKFRLSKLGFENSRPSYNKGFGPFDEILPTIELGFTKPHPLIFENALKTIGIPASQIIVVGDRPEVDLVPAKKLGMKTILVSWGKEFPGNVSGIDVVIPTIYDLGELV